MVPTSVDDVKDNLLRLSASNEEDPILNAALVEQHELLAWMITRPELVTWMVDVTGEVG